ILPPPGLDAGPEKTCPAPETANHAAPKAVTRGPFVSPGFASPAWRYSGWPLYSTCGAPSDRGVVVSSAALSPGAGTGMPCARTGGHAAAEAAAQELLPRESLRNRYTVRPRESTRTLPRLPAGSSAMVAGRPLAVFGGHGVSLPPPHAAMAGAASGPLAAVATMGRDAQREF